MTDKTEQGKKPKLSEEERTPFLTNALPMRIYHIRFNKPDYGADELAGVVRHCVNAGLFTHIDPLSECETSTGYCDARDPANIEAKTICSMPLPGRVVLGVRIDTLKINGSTLRVKVAEKIKAMKAEGKIVNKYVRKELKEQFKRELRKTVPPTSKTIPIVWSVYDGLLRVFTSSASVADEVVMLFNRTFGDLLSSGVPDKESGPAAMPTSPRAMGLLGGLLASPMDEPPSIDGKRSVLHEPFFALYERGIHETAFVKPAEIKIRRED